VVKVGKGVFECVLSFPSHGGEPGGFPLPLSLSLSLSLSHSLSVESVAGARAIQRYYGEGELINIQSISFSLLDSDRETSAGNHSY